MAKKTKKIVKAQKSGTKRKKTTARSAAKKKVAKAKPAKVKKSSSARSNRTTVKASKPKRKSVASRKGPIASAASRSHRPAKSKPEGTKQQADNLHPGMMGDGTEEQNLNQQGDPGARITQDDVEEGFKKSD